MYMKNVPRLQVFNGTYKKLNSFKLTYFNSFHNIKLALSVATQRRRNPATPAPPLMWLCSVAWIYTNHGGGEEISNKLSEVQISFCSYHVPNSHCVLHIFIYTSESNDTFVICDLWFVDCGGGHLHLRCGHVQAWRQEFPHHFHHHVYFQVPCLVFRYASSQSSWG